VTEQLDLVVRNAYLQSGDEVRDIGIGGGRIERIASEIEGTAREAVDADGNLVSPGFVDAHVHFDQALSRSGERKPTDNESAFDKERSLTLAREHFGSTSRETIEETALEVGRKAVTNGVLHARTHAYADPDVGTKAVDATLAAREQLADLLDLQVVAFPQQGILEDGTERVLRESVEAGADLLGGLDPASHNEDMTRTLDAWFDLATDLDVDLDVHLHDGGTLGLYTFDRLLAWIHRYGYEGRVTASHSFALADAAGAGSDEWVPGGSFEALIERFDEAGLGFATCYLSTKPEMPVKRLQDDGVVLGHGSDQVRDMWSTHGNIDPLEEALIQSLQLTTDDFTTNENLDRIWELLTRGGAELLDIEDDYGIVTGTPADLVVHDSLSRQWAIVEGNQPRVVIKDGTVVARDGELVA